MKGCMHGNSVNDRKDPRLRRGSNAGSQDHRSALIPLNYRGSLRPFGYDTDYTCKPRTKRKAAVLV